MGRRCFTCCIVVFLIAAVIVGAVAFAVAYVPEGTKVAEKLIAQGLNAVYVGIDSTTVGTDAGLQFAAALLLSVYIATYTDVTFSGIVAFQSEAEPDAEPETMGYMLYTDSIKSASLMVVSYYKDGNPSTVEDLPVESHASIRGKAFFVGNVNAEIALRKIIF